MCRMRTPTCWRRASICSARSRRSVACSSTGVAPPASHRASCVPNSPATWATPSGSSRRSTRSMRKRPGSVFLVAVFVLLVATGTLAQREPTIPTPRGFVTDSAGVLSPSVIARLTALATELQAKTGAEIAVLTVETTAPLDDFSYAMKVVDTWRPGRKRDDTGLLVLLAVRDRKLRILTGYGLEGILPDGLVGEIQDQEIVPAFRAGRMDEGIWRGVAALAQRIASARGVELTGVPPPRAHPRGRSPFPLWAIILLVVVFGLLMLYGASQ